MKRTMKQRKKLDSMKQREIQEEQGNIQHSIDELFSFFHWMNHDLDSIEKRMAAKFFTEEAKHCINVNVEDILEALKGIEENLSLLEGSLESIEIVESL